MYRSTKHLFCHKKVVFSFLFPFFLRIGKLGSNASAITVHMTFDDYFTWKTKIILCKQYMHALSKKNPIKPN